MSSIDAIIIGAGPAGTSCALWLKQLGFKPLLIDRQDACGGLQNYNPYTNTWIATSHGTWGKDVAQAMHRNMLEHEVPMRLRSNAVEAAVTQDGVTVTLDSAERLQSRFLVLASGVVPKAAGYTSRLGLLVGPGPIIANTNFTGARVAILGGGDTACENYQFAKERGARAVHMYARSLRARAEMLQRVDPHDLHVGDYLVQADEQKVNGEIYDQILVFYGFEANRSALLGLDLGMRPDGFVSTRPDCSTNLPNVYAIGEVTQRAHPCCVSAMADGVTAAKAIQRSLESSSITRYLNTAKRIGAAISKVTAT